MANKYFFRVPYSCSTYWKKTGYVYADDVEEAAERIDSGDTYDESYEDDDSDNYTYYTDEADIEIEEEDVENPDSEESSGSSSSFRRIDQDVIPSYFLSEIQSL